jgi:hypothetical protein
MNHPVSVQLYHLFMKRGFATLRFNFRGVGRSQGEFDAGIGELADAATALDWLQSNNPAASPDLGRRLSVRRLYRHAAADAPPGDGRLHLGVAADQHVRLQLPGPLPGLGPVPDTARPTPSSRRSRSSAWSTSCAPRRASSSTTRWIDKASHFWAEHLPFVEKSVGDYLDKRIEMNPIS